MINNNLQFFSYHPFFRRTFSVLNCLNLTWGIYKKYLRKINILYEDNGGKLSEKKRKEKKRREEINRRAAVPLKGT